MSTSAHFDGGGFAVVDVETTGLYPSKDRIVEIAVVLVDASGSTSNSFASLINPGRDVGPTHLHGLTASDVYDAPTFAEAAPTVWALLSGRVFVAHNVQFDLTFIDAELRRLGSRLPPPPTMCTMRLSGSYLARLPARTLNACCESAGIDIGHHHSALDDAVAAARLLAAFRAAHETLPESWREELRVAQATSWEPMMPPTLDFRPLTRSEKVEKLANEESPLAALVHRLPRSHMGDTEHYLGLLDRVLEDRLVTDDEVTELTKIALSYGLSVADAERAHRDYLSHLAGVVWNDGTVTDQERSDFKAVARLLLVPDDEAEGILEAGKGQRTVPATGDTLEIGDRVVFTGEMTLTREEIESLAIGKGLRPTASVSKKTALVVVADPHSQSGKAKRARELGIRVVTEQVFLSLLA